VSVIGTVAAIGTDVAVQGFGLAGALILAADGPDEVRAAWRSLPADVAVVILTREAATAVPDLAGVGLPLAVVVP
jgi:vacuolar-type H+-ATPase subunit F/Vma7